jgi:hypothetical protein
MSVFVSCLFYDKFGNDSVAIFLVSSTIITDIHEIDEIMKHFEILLKITFDHYNPNPSLLLVV